MENKQRQEIEASLNTETRTCKFVDLKENGLIIKLEGYPLSFIRIINNKRTETFSVLFRDNDGWIYKVIKNVKGELLSATINKVVERVVCT